VNDYGGDSPYLLKASPRDEKVSQSGSLDLSMPARSSLLDTRPTRDLSRSVGLSADTTNMSSRNSAYALSRSVGLPTADAMRSSGCRSARTMPRSVGLPPADAMGFSGSHSARAQHGSTGPHTTSAGATWHSNRVPQPCTTQAQAPLSGSTHLSSGSAGLQVTSAGVARYSDHLYTPRPLQEQAPQSGFHSARGPLRPTEVQRITTSSAGVLLQGGQVQSQCATSLQVQAPRSGDYSAHLPAWSTGPPMPPASPIPYSDQPAWWQSQIPVTGTSSACSAVSAGSSVMYVESSRMQAGPRPVRIV